MDVLHAMHGNDWAQEGGAGGGAGGGGTAGTERGRHQTCPLLIKFRWASVEAPRVEEVECTRNQKRGGTKKRKQSKVRTCPGQDRTNRHTSRHAQRASERGYEWVSERDSQIKMAVKSYDLLTGNEIEDNSIEKAMPTIDNLYHWPHMASECNRYPPCPVRPLVTWSLGLNLKEQHEINDRIEEVLHTYIYSRRRLSWLPVCFLIRFT